LKLQDHSRLKDVSGMNKMKSSSFSTVDLHLVTKPVNRFHHTTDVVTACEEATILVKEAARAIIMEATQARFVQGFMLVQETLEEPSD
jgi:hypothetical protein